MIIVEVVAQELGMTIWEKDALIWNTGNGAICRFKRLSFSECALVLDGLKTPGPFSNKWNPLMLQHEIGSRKWFPVQIALTDDGVTFFVNTIAQTKDECAHIDEQTMKEEHDG